MATNSILPPGELAVLCDADQKLPVGRPRHHKLLIDRAFAVPNLDAVRGLFEDLVGRLDAFRPAAAQLVLS
jgi:hypothetical protein